VGSYQNEVRGGSERFLDTVSQWWGYTNWKY